MDRMSGSCNRQSQGCVCALLRNGLTLMPTSPTSVAEIEAEFGESWEMVPMVEPVTMSKSTLGGELGLFWSIMVTIMLSPTS